MDYGRHLNFNRTHYRKTKRDAKNAERKVEAKITGADKEAEYIEFARKNAERFNLQDKVDFYVADFFDRTIPTQGIMMSNPPYGVRLKKSMPDFYHQISSILKQKGDGALIWLFSGDEEGEKDLGLKPFKKHKLYNGNISSWFNGYEIVKGSMKNKEN